MPRWCDRLFHRNGKCNSCICTESRHNPSSRSWGILTCCCCFCGQGEAICLGPSREAWVILGDEHHDNFLNPPCLLELRHLEKTQPRPFLQPRCLGWPSMHYWRCVLRLAISFAFPCYVDHRRDNHAKLCLDMHQTDKWRPDVLSW